MNIHTLGPLKYRRINYADRADLYERMTKGDVCLFNEYEQMVVRFTPSGDVFVKLKGGTEFKAKEGSTTVADTLLEGKEISPEAYGAYS